MIVRAYKNRRLAYIGQKGNSADFCLNHWDNIDSHAWLDGTKSEGPGYFEKVESIILRQKGR